MLLSPTDHTLVLIDFQSQMAFATKSIDPVVLRNNAGLVANAAKIFNVPTIPTTVAEKTFSGPMFDEIKAAFPKATFIDRTTMNSWEDTSVIEEVNRIGKSRIVLAGLWTSVCIVGPALSALDQGFEVYFITDACGDVSEEAHERAIERMVQAGAQRRLVAEIAGKRDVANRRIGCRGAAYRRQGAVAAAVIDKQELDLPERRRHVFQRGADRRDVRGLLIGRHDD